MIQEFIILHMADDNTPAMINVSQIEQVYINSEGTTNVTFVNNDDDMIVNETPERIYNIIYNRYPKEPKKKENKSSKEKTSEVLHD